MKKSEVVSHGIKIRWITCACFEIVLPSGKKIITDPYITDSTTRNSTLEDVTGADYMLITHTHFDHITDIKYLAEKFNSKILTGLLSTYDLANHYDMNPKYFYPVTNGDVFEFEDCKIEVLFGKHIDLPFTLGQIGSDIERQHGYKNMERVNENGSLEFVNYVITTPNNLKILLWGGKVVVEQMKRFSAVKPNIALMQLPGNDLEDLSKFIGIINPQIVIPHHHDSLSKPGPLGIIDVNEVLADFASAIDKNAPYSTLLDPEYGQWYDVAMNVSAVINNTN